MTRDHRISAEYELAQNIVTKWLGPDGEAWVDHSGSHRACELVELIAEALRPSTEAVWDEAIEKAAKIFDKRADENANSGGAIWFGEDGKPFSCKGFPTKPVKPGSDAADRALQNKLDAATIRSLKRQKGEG